MKVLLLWLAAALIIIVMTRVSNLCGSVIHANSRKQSEVYQNRRRRRRSKAIAVSLLLDLPELGW